MPRRELESRLPVLPLTGEVVELTGEGVAASSIGAAILALAMQRGQ